MSKETLHLLMTMNHDNLETQIAMQCAPLLTGMKISNLLTVGSRKKQEVLRTFRRTSISCYVLYESGEKTTFLLYRKQKLESYLDQPQIKQLMERFGYGCQDPVSILRRPGDIKPIWKGDAAFLMRSACCWDIPRRM